MQNSCVEVNSHSDEHQYKDIQRRLTRSQRQEDGIFFTGPLLADRVASKVKRLLQNGKSVGDPTSGAGDLLLACLKYYPIHKCLSKTQKYWSSRVSGVELHPFLAHAANERIDLLLRNRVSHLGENTNKSFEPADAKLGVVNVNNYLDDPDKLSGVDVIVMNPPFGSFQYSRCYDWTSGLTQKAAIFFWEVVNAAKPLQEIVAILPDVVRSGFRYVKLRDRISSIAHIIEIDPVGRFDAEADVDVFIIHIRKRRVAVRSSNRGSWNAPDVAGTSKFLLSDFCRVSVGSIVPYRHKSVGLARKYLDVTSAVVGEALKDFQKINTENTLHKGPFVVVRRTSSPSDASRIVLSIYAGFEEIAVENHLIVLQPYSELPEDCNILANDLMREETTVWLNRYSRCRHLTTRLLKCIPLRHIK